MLDKLKEILREFLQTSWVERLHTFYVIVALIGMFLAINGKAPSTKENIYLIFFGAYFLFLLLLFVAMAVMYARKSRYTESPKSLHDALHVARDTYHYLRQYLDGKRSFDPDVVKSMLQDSLTSVTQAFAIVTGVNCRASIKLFGGGATGKEADIIVSTLARDNVSARQCEEYDCNNVTHRIVDNTDFSQIFRGKIPYFFSNNLPALEHYENSHLEAINQVQIGPNSPGYWPLEYKSTIVWPIRYLLKPEEREKEGGKKQELFGFLTIDSNSRNVFNRPIDTQMGALIADALYSVLEVYNAATFKYDSEVGSLTEEPK